MYRFLILLFCLFSVLFTGNALPIAVRQDAVPQPTTVTTTNTQDTAVGQMVTTCEITLTPVKDAAGNDAVEQVTKCKVAMNGTNNGSSDGADPPASQGEAATTSESAPTTETPAETTSPQIVTETVTTDTAATTAAETTSETQGGAETTPNEGGAITTADGATTAADGATTSAAESPAATTGAVRDNGVSSVAVSDISSLLESTATAAAEGGEATTTADAQGAVSTGQAEGQSGQAEGEATASAAEQNEAEASASAASTIELPGKKLSVLPIGLGVFAGISVIALIVVGLVTYERTKYRKAFRQRKLAEQGASMGYSGNMTERA